MLFGIVVDCRLLFVVVVRGCLLMLLLCDGVFVLGCCWSLLWSVRQLSLLFSLAFVLVVRCDCSLCVVVVCSRGCCSCLLSCVVVDVNRCWLLMS